MDAVAEVCREQAGHLTAWLMRAFGDLPLAEDVVQEALPVALERWPVDGVPAEPAAWLRTVARRRAIDRVRRDVAWRARVASLGEPVRTSGDDRLELLFLCCHPALSVEAQIALTLRAVCGLNSAEIASGFVIPEPTLAQRLVRARKKIASAGIAFRLPQPDELDSRLRQVLLTLYLMFNAGYLAGAPGTSPRRDIALDAAWLAGLVARLFPTEPEAHGLLALMRLHLARAPARFDSRGELLLLRDQDRSRWDQRAIRDAVGLIEHAAAMRRPGPYQLQAAIAACHAEARNWSSTDWAQILVLYDMLLRLAPSPVTRLHRSVAVWQVLGPAEALREVDSLAPALDGYYLQHAVRAELLRALHRSADADAADALALGLTHNPAEQALLVRRLARAC